MSKPAKEIVILLKNGLRVAAKTWGSSESAIRVMALHGWMDNAGTHDTVAPYLAGAGMYVVAIDFIGHGRSQHVPPETEPYFMNYVLQVIDTAHALGWESFHLFAHSMGAAVASLVAAVAPSMVRSMVLFDAIGPVSSKVSSAKQLEDAIRDRRMYLNRKPKLYSTVQDAITKLRENNADIAEHTAKNIVTRGTIQVEGGFQFCHDPRLLAKSMTVFRESDVLDYLQRIRCPVLLVWAQGTVDRYKLTSTHSVPPVIATQMASPSGTGVVTGAGKETTQKTDNMTNEAQNTQNVNPPSNVPLQDTTAQRPEVQNPKVPTKEDEPHPIMGLMAPMFDRRMAEIQFLTKITVPGTHHVHSDDPLTVLPHVLSFLCPLKAKL
jgi:pimeloyl-ACP methyl ester carboxylesterase